MKQHNSQRGFSLIELLVALAIGSFLIIGAVTMQANTRKTFTVNEQQARLQETARYVLSVLEPEFQLAGRFGYTNRPEDIRFPAVNALASQMRQSSTAIAGLPAALTSCGNNFALDVIQTVQAANNTYGLACPALGGGHNGISDTITIRRSGDTDVAPTNTKFQLQTSRIAQFDQRLFVSGVLPGITSVGDVQVRDMIVESYYVAINADNRPGVPALRIKQLVAGPALDDQEVIRGVEDIQVEFGVDPGVDLDLNGIADDVNGATSRYVPPNNAIVTSGQVVAVRLWVRVRAEEQEPGFNNNRSYTYAGVTYTPPANDHFRRVLMSRTIFLRNSRVWTD